MKDYLKRIDWWYLATMAIILGIWGILFLQIGIKHGRSFCH